jgi:hypothetical protein
MPRIHVLDVPEFAGLVIAARNSPRVTILPSRAGYITISSQEDLVFERRATGFRPAVWYSCCSGGVEGEIAEFNHDALRISNVGAKS